MTGDKSDISGRQMGHKVQNSGGYSAQIGHLGHLDEEQTGHIGQTKRTFVIFVTIKMSVLRGYVGR